MKKWITKKDEKSIIAAYSIRPGDIIPYELEHTYEYVPAVKAGKAAMISLKPEIKGSVITGRVIVSHSDSEGRIVCVDVWRKDDQGIFRWFCRNPADKPLSDYEVFNDLERQIDLMKSEYRKLKDTTAKSTKPAGRRPNPAKLNEQAKQIQELINKGLKEKEILKIMKISRATYYRAKKRSLNK